MDPYNSNPFYTDTSRESKSEYAANRELVKTLRDIAECQSCDPWNEFGTLDFDRECPEDHIDWHEQREEWIEERDTREELERIEEQAEAEELRHNGYWD